VQIGPRPTPTSFGAGRIGVLRALMLGDLLCAVPALRALRGAFPQADVTLVGLAWAHEFADRFPHYLNAFLELPGFPGLPERPVNVRALAAMLADAQAREFDLVLQLHGSGEASNVLAVLLGGRRTAGFYRPDGYCPDPETFIPYPDGIPEPLRLLRAVEALGAPPAGEQLEFPVREDDRRELDSITAFRRVRATPYAVVHPGARLEVRRWTAEGFAAVADGLVRRGLSIVLTGSAAERTLTRAVADAMDAPAVDLAGQTSLGALAALLDGARIVVCNDTGVSHLAAAVGAPSVVVFTTSDQTRWAPLDVRRHRAVQAALGQADGVLRAAEEMLVAG
jgi:ADP-heptose:LPS heptosyltransferase